jgi:hypothetical protein
MLYNLYILSIAVRLRTSRASVLVFPSQFLSGMLVRSQFNTEPVEVSQLNGSQLIFLISPKRAKIVLHFPIVRCVFRIAQ